MTDLRTQLQAFAAEHTDEEIDRYILKGDRYLLEARSSGNAESISMWAMHQSVLLDEKHRREIAS